MKSEKYFRITIDPIQQVETPGTPLLTSDYDDCSILVGALAKSSYSLNRQSKHKTVILPKVFRYGVYTEETDVQVVV